MTTPPDLSSAFKGALRSRRLLTLLIGLVAISAIALYQKEAPRRKERWLQQATLADLQQQVARAPDDARAYYQLGLRLRDAGRIPEAADTLKRAAELAPQDEDAWLEWVRTVYRAAGPQAAHKVLEEFLRVHPNSARGHAALASLYARNKYWASALEEATKAASLDAGNQEAWQTMGRAGLQVPDYGRAERGFQRCVALAPTDWHGYLGLSEVYSAQGRSAEAVSQGRAAVRQAPDEPETHLQLGKLLLRTANSSAEVEAALQELKAPLGRPEALTLEQQFFAAFYLGQSYERLSDWTRARTFLEGAALLSPNDPTVLHELTTVYQRLGDQPYLANTAKRLKEINAYLSETKALSDRIAGAPSDLEARLKLARLHAAHGDIEAALKDYGLLLLRAPDMAVAKREFDALKQRNSGGTR